VKKGPCYSTTSISGTQANPVLKHIQQKHKMHFGAKLLIFLRIFEDFVLDQEFLKSFGKGPLKILWNLRTFTPGRFSGVHVATLCMALACHRLSEPHRSFRDSGRNLCL
jgi:hypothetical protein